jgi:hypothetical protein
MHFKNDRETSIPLYERVDLLDAAERDELIHCIDFAKCHQDLHEQLYQLHSRGPVEDGHVISKSDRDALLKIGACVKVCVHGKQGYNACTYFGSRLLRIYDWMHGTLATTQQTVTLHRIK